MCAVNGFAVGGGELKLLELVSELKGRHPGAYRVTVAAVGQGGPLQPRFERTADRTAVFEKRHRHDLSQVWGLAKLMREERPDVVLTTLFYADVIGTFAAKIAGARRVVSWEAVTQPYGPRHLFAYRIAAKGLSAAVSVSEAIRLQLITDRRVPGRKTRTIHYGVDTVRFRPRSGNGLRARLGLPRNALVLGTVARLTPQKGHEHLVAAAADILRSRPDALFVLAGDGPLRGAIEARARSLGVHKAFRFLGYRSDVADLLAVFDVFVLPSLYEGLPNAVLEAMASGKPVVATAVDGTPEAVVHGSTGMLVPPSDPSALAGAVLHVLSDPGRMRRMGAAGRDRAVREFGLAGQIEAFHRLFQELTDSSSIERGAA
jgi:glycosyltransferase involved in cell wall biosynthesis